MASFDVVNQVDQQEVRNAVDQANREVVNRYDFRGTDTRFEVTEAGISAESASEGRLDAAIDVLHSKLVRRQVSLKVLGGGEPKQVGGGRWRADFTPPTAAKSSLRSLRR